MTLRAKLDVALTEMTATQEQARARTAMMLC